MKILTIFIFNIQKTQITQFLKKIPVQFNTFAVTQRLLYYYFSIFTETVSSLKHTNSLISYWWFPIIQDLTIMNAINKIK